MEERSLRRGGQEASEGRGDRTPPLVCNLSPEFAAGAQGEAAYIGSGVSSRRLGGRKHLEFLDVFENQNLRSENIGFYNVG